jgi:hypothetical protein
MGIIGTCGECDFYDECEQPECPKDKDPHGHCYVDPPGLVMQPDESPGAEKGAWAPISRTDPGEVYADRPGCRFWRK